jgi:DNA repair exonuclease SbcCD nuclease subunit
MLFSHISNMHLGLVQYASEEREQDVYLAFNESIDTSIKDHVDFVIFAGDIFNVPNPSGTAIVQMGNALKRLKQNNIDSFFILGEHDISRVRSTPIPYVYHNLEFSKYIGQGTPIEYKGILLAGFDKIRKTEISQFEEKFAQVDKIANEHTGHKILVLHQGITEFNKFAGE